MDKVRPATGDPVAERGLDGSKTRVWKLNLPGYVTKRMSRGGGTWYYTHHEEDVTPADALRGTLASLHAQALSLGIHKIDWTHMLNTTLEESKYGSVGMEPRRKRGGAVLLNGSAINKKANRKTDGEGG